MSLNIFQRINAVRKSIGYIQKDKSVSTGGGSYRAITHDVVTAIVREHMIEHGIVCIPNLIASHSDPKEEDAKQFRYVATYSFDFVNVDQPEEKVTIVIEAHAMDNSDKAPGKAISYAKKYAVLKLFEIETGEDEESRYQPVETINDEQVANILALADEVKADMVKFRKFIKVDKLENLPVASYAAAVHALEAKRVAA